MRGCILSIAIAVALSGCASKPIANRVVPPVDPLSLAEVAGEPLAVRASPVWDEDWLLENFGANLVLAHVLAVRVAIENRDSSALDVRKFTIAINDQAGRSFRQLSPKAARKLIEKTYPLGIRSVEGDKAYRADFDANTLDLKTALGPGQARQGFVFFEMPVGVSREVPLEMRVAAIRR